MSNTLANSEAYLNMDVCIGTYFTIPTRVYLVHILVTTYLLSYDIFLLLYKHGFMLYMVYLLLNFVKDCRKVHEGVNAAK